MRYGRLSHRYFHETLALAHKSHSTLLMSGWKSAIRQLTAEARLHLYARSLSRKTGIGLHAAALYGAFAIIVGVVFGTLSVHPF
jgi:hypothetical protein